MLCGIELLNVKVKYFVVLLWLMLQIFAHWQNTMVYCFFVEMWSKVFLACEIDLDFI